MKKRFSWSILFFVLTTGLLAQAISQKDAQKDLADLEQTWEHFSSDIFNKFTPYVSINGSMEDITNGYQKLLDAYRDLEKGDLKKLNKQLQDFEGRYGNQARTIDQTMEQALGSRPNRRASYMWEELKKGQEKLQSYPADMADKLVKMVERDLQHIKSLSDRIRGQKFDQMKTLLEMAVKFNPKNKEAEDMLDSIGSQKKNEMAEIDKKIDATEWPPHSGRFNGPGTPDTLAREAEKFLELDKDGNRKDTILAVRISGDWMVAEKTITGNPLTYGLPVHVAYRPTKDPKTTSVQSLTVVTRDNKKQPPFKTYWVGDSWQIRTDKIKGAGGSGPNWLFRLVLSFMLILSGIMALQPFLRTKAAGLADILQPFQPLKSTIGVVTLLEGGVFFVLGIFHPFSDILPQAVAVVTGLFLGLEKLIRPSQTPPPPPPGVLDTPVGPPPPPPGTPPAPPAPPTAGVGQQAIHGASQFASASAHKAQELLRKNEQRIKSLESIQVPLGFACFILGILHLFAGGALFF